MTIRDLTPRDTLIQGALFGVSAWLAFGAIEYALWAIWPRFARVHCGTAPLVWSAGLDVYALYPIGGALAGAIAASLTRFVFPRAEARIALPRSAVLGLLAAVAFGTLVQFEPRGTGAALLVMTAVLALNVGAGVISRRWAEASAVSANVWVVAILVLGVARLGAQGEFGEPKFFIYRCLAGYVVLTVLLAGFALRRVRHANQGTATGSTVPSSSRSLALSAIAASLVVATAMALDFSAHFAGSRPAPENPRPNVILIVMDTVRADHLSVNGYARKTTPNLDRMAAGATVYARAIAPANHTLPSHASLFTGLYPISHGAHPLAAEDRRTPSAEGLALGSRFRTLAETLSARGYLTAGVAANYAFVSSGYNLDQGFDLFATRFSRCAPPSPFPLLRPLSPVSPAGPPSNGYFAAPDINRDVFALVGRLQRKPNPFFQFVNYMDAHGPNAPAPPFDRRFAGKDAAFTLEEFRDLRDRVLQQRRSVTAKEREHVISQYDGAIALLDEQLGRLFGYLKRLGIYDSSLIIVTADHGEAFGERDLFEHGTSVYQDQVHIPLIIKFPNQQEARVVREPVSLTDIVPTVLDVVGLAPDKDAEGTTLRRPADSLRRAVVSESYPRPYFLNLSSRFHRIDRAYLKDRYKLIVSTGGESELYDLDADPREQQNVAAANVDVLERMTTEFNEWLATAVVGTGEAPQIDSETLERLRSLGYLK
jgi:arylsulfatase A-like enzyme